MTIEVSLWRFSWMMLVSHFSQSVEHPFWQPR
jgi:hypothetical protein